MTETIANRIPTGGKPNRAKKGGQPQRRCIGCRQSSPPLRMVRFVRDQDESIKIDVRHRMPGRGAYLHLRWDCVRTALKRKAFKHSLRTHQTDIEPKTLVEQMTEAIEVRFFERLGLARRAGAVEIGAEAVQRSMRLGEAKFISMASDASGSTQGKLGKNAVRKEIPSSQLFDGTRLAKPIGWDFAAAIAVTAEPFATDLRHLSDSLEDLRKTSEKKEE